MNDIDDESDGIEWDSKREAHLQTELDALDGLDQISAERQGRAVETLSYRMKMWDQALADNYAEHDSRFDADKPLDPARHDRILQGDAGEAYTRVRLGELHDFHLIEAQPKAVKDGEGKIIKPDFVVKSRSQPGRFDEIVDSKAWRPADRTGMPGDGPARLPNMTGLRRMVERYSSSPQLTDDGRVVAYLPEDMIWRAPQDIERIESWSGTELAHGKTVEVRSMGIWLDDDLEAAMRRRVERRRQ